MKGDYTIYINNIPRIQEKRETEFEKDSKGKVRMSFKTKEKFTRKEMAKISLDTTDITGDDKEYIQVWDREKVTAIRQLEGANREEVLNRAKSRVKESYKYLDGNIKFYSHNSGSHLNLNFTSAKNGENLHFTSKLSNLQNLSKKFSHNESNFDGPTPDEHLNVKDYTQLNFKQVTGNYVTREGAKNADLNDLKWTKWRGEGV